MLKHAENTMAENPKNVVFSPISEFLAAQGRARQVSAEKRNPDSGQLADPANGTR